ncbi:MAG: dihydroorotate dehydrogenase [Methanocalculus sp. MSAO_Arc2]|uniref:dihydroorotate dehydrogenase n=1 Tax=Methanocalculus sp. MSAO_Arc2 TaxID=2293855 RepID=UPI000FEFA525|nr:MAG: dihydroorotate dehydrogenase [Methanocalculus sp. MSAO_Arc2]
MIMRETAPVEVGGVMLYNHLILAAGVLGTTGASLQRMLKLGAGAVVTKSIGPEPVSGHHGPCLVPLDGGLLNAMGLPNPSRAFVEEISDLSGKPVVVSIYGGTPAQFYEVASWFEDVAAGYELNLSCPHAEGYGAAIGSDPDCVFACTEEVASFGLPTWVKVTPNVTDITSIGRAAEAGGATAIVAINTVRAMRISIELGRPVLGNRFGGLSGGMIFPIALRCVYDLYEACSIPVIGCGGVSTAEQVIEMMMAGASAVQIGSAVYNDIGIFHKIASRLYSEDGTSVDEIVGCAHA